MYGNKENKEDGKADYGYVEIDPTGRYGRVSSKVSTFLFLFFFQYFSISLHLFLAFFILFDFGLYVCYKKRKRFGAHVNGTSRMDNDMIVFCVYMCT